MFTVRECSLGKCWMNGYQRHHMGNIATQSIFGRFKEKKRNKASRNETSQHETCELSLTRTIQIWHAINTESVSKVSNILHIVYQSGLFLLYKLTNLKTSVSQVPILCHLFSDVTAGYFNCLLKSQWVVGLML